MAAVRGGCRHPAGTKGVRRPGPPDRAPRSGRHQGRAARRGVDRHVRDAERADRAPSPRSARRSATKARTPGTSKPWRNAATGSSRRSPSSSPRAPDAPAGDRDDAPAPAVAPPPAPPASSRLRPPAARRGPLLALLGLALAAVASSSTREARQPDSTPSDLQLTPPDESPRLQRHARAVAGRARRRVRVGRDGQPRAVSRQPRAGQRGSCR